MVLLGWWDGGDGLTEDREKRLEVEAGEEVESERLRLKDISELLESMDRSYNWNDGACISAWRWRRS